MKQQRFLLEDVLTLGGLTVEGQFSSETSEITDSLTIGGLTLKPVTPVNLTGPIEDYTIFTFLPGFYSLAQLTVTLTDSANSYLYGASFGVGHNGTVAELSTPFSVVDLWGTEKPVFSATLEDGEVNFKVTADSETLSIALEAKLFTTQPSYFISISAQPSNQTVVEGDVPATFSVAASSNDGGNLSFLWQVDDGTGFEDLEDNSSYSGSSTSTLTVTTEDTSFSSYVYRCRIGSDGGSPDVFSESATLTVEEASVTITQQPSNQTVEEGDPAEFSVEASTNETLSTLSYEWQEDSGGGYAVIEESEIYEDVDTDTLTITDSTNLDGYSYRCRVFTNSEVSPEATSDSATLTVTPL